MNMKEISETIKRLILCMVVKEEETPVKVIQKYSQQNHRIKSPNLKKGDACKGIKGIYNIK